MAATSYTALPSSSYVGLGSDGDLYHDANFGSYGTGIGSLTSHPYQYQTRPFGDDLTNGYQPNSYAEELLRTAHAHGDHPGEQPEHYPNDRYAQGPSSNNQASKGFHSDDNHATQPLHKTTTDYQQHHASHSDTTQYHQPPPGDNHHHPMSPKSQRHHPTSTHTGAHPADHALSPKSQRQPPHANHPPPSKSQHQPLHANHPTPPKSQHHPPPHANHPASPKSQHHPPPHANHVASPKSRPHQPHVDHPASPKSQHQQQHANHQISSKSQHQQSHVEHAGPHPDDHPTPPKSQHHSPNRPPVRSDPNSRDHPTPPKPAQQQQRHQSQPNQQRSEHQIPKQPPPGRRRSPSQNGREHPSAPTPKTSNPPPEMRPTKAMKIRAAAIKQKEEAHEQKRKDGNFPRMKKKPTPPISKPSHSASDDEHDEHPKSKRTKKTPHSVPKEHKSRHEDHHHTEDNNTSADEDLHEQHSRNKSKKRTAFSDSRHEKHPALPPIRRGHGPPYYDPIYDHPYPYRGRHPYYDDYPPYPPYGRHGHRYPYDDPYDVPPYVAGYRDPYDGIFDYEKRKGKSRSKKHSEKKDANTDHEDHDAVTGNETEHDDDAKSVQSKKGKTSKKKSKDEEYEREESARRRWAHRYYGTSYYDEPQALEMWRQERNDYLKKSFKPTVHDVLYAQQWMKSDSYLENQRRRAVRDTQGYYFPYKKYTLKDYKDLQKQEAQQNPYADVVEPTLDRKERAKKRQQYAAQIERQVVDSTGGVHLHTPRDVPARKAWLLNNNESNDLDRLSKRERALEYAKEQLVKHRPQRAPKNRTQETDPTEQYVNSLFPQENEDDEAYERDNQSNGEQ